MGREWFRQFQGEINEYHQLGRSRLRRLPVLCKPKREHRQQRVRRAGGKTNPLTQLFKSIDSDSDGSLTASELSTALSSNSDDDSKIDIDGLLSMLDQDGGGTVSESELAQALPPPPPPPGEQGQDVQSLFAGLDSDGDDSVSSGELSTLVNGDSASSTQLLDLLDSDKSGALSLQELQEAMQPRDPPPRPPSSADASGSDGTQQAYAALVQMAVGQYRSIGGSATTSNLVDLAA